MQEVAHRLHELAVLTIDDRRVEPLRDRGIPLLEEREALADVPADDVPEFVVVVFNHVGRGREFEIAAVVVGVDEAYVVVGVGRRIAPAAAPRLDGVENADAVALFERGESGFNFVDGVDGHDDFLSGKSWVGPSKEYTPTRQSECFSTHLGRSRASFIPEESL